MYPAVQRPSLPARAPARAVGARTETTETTDARSVGASTAEPPESSGTTSTNADGTDTAQSRQDEAELAARAARELQAARFNDAIQARTETLREMNLLLELCAEQHKQDDELVKKSIALIA